MKKCAKCKEEKPVEGFYANPNNKDGLSGSCCLCIREYAREYWNKTKDIRAVKSKAWKKNNPDKMSAYRAKYRQNNPEKVSESLRKHKEKYKVTHIGSVMLRNIARMERDLPKKLGYSVGDFIRHIESNFKPGMSWENYGEWEIDHIIPQSSFDPEDNVLKKAHALSNLQPLWAEENRSKGRKIISA